MDISMEEAFQLALSNMDASYQKYRASISRTDKESVASSYLEGHYEDIQESANKVIAIGRAQQITKNLKARQR
jgi:hypothetical protein